MTRKKQGKDECPSTAIVDSQSIKNSEWGIPDKGFDGNKKSREENIISCLPGWCQSDRVDTLGVLLGIIVTEANVHDSVAARALLIYMKGKLPKLRRVLADAGYLGEELVFLAGKWLHCVFEVVKRSEEKGFKVIPKPWIVERSIAWFNGYRRLSRNYEANMKTNENWAYIASIDMLLRKI